MAWLGICFCISKTCGEWWNAVGSDKETNEEHGEDC